MHLYRDQFSTTHDFPDIEAPSKVLVIASTARSGSHMIGHALHATGCFGFPLEYVNPANLAQWRKQLQTGDLEQTLAAVQRRRTSPNGVFTIKIHYSHIAQFGGFSGLKRIFPDAYYLLFRREAVLKQAVSLSIALQTGVWIAGQQPSGGAPRYDYRQIDGCLRETLRDTAAWRYTLAVHGCRHIEMTLDEARDDMPAAIGRIARFMDVPLNPEQTPQQPVTVKQSNELNRAWERRFLADHSRRYGERGAAAKEKAPCFGPDAGLIPRLKRGLKGLVHA